MAFNDVKTYCLNSLALVILIAGCSNESEKSIPAELAGIENLTIVEPDLTKLPVFHPEPVLVIGNKNSSPIGMMSSVVTDSSGRTFIADSQLRLVHVFDPTGTRITTIGRDGDGPGEFRGLGDLRISDGQLHVLDPALLRVNRFDLATLQFNGSTAISVDGSPSEHFLPYTYFMRPDESYLMILTGPPTQSDTNKKRVWDAVILNRDGNWADSIHLSVPAAEWIFEFTDNYQVSMRPPYGRTSLLQADENGRLFHVWSENLLVKGYDNKGQYEQAWYVDYPKRELERGAVMKLFESRSSSEDPRFNRLIRNQPMPNTWPAANHFLIDDEGRFWISTYTEDPNQWRWLVLNSATNRVEGTFLWPKSRHIHQIKNGFIYSWGNENRTGNQTLNKYNF
jgi:hypothetical protein